MNPLLAVGAIAAAVATVITTVVTGYFAIKLRRTPDRTTESSDRIAEWRAINEVRAAAMDEQEKRLEAQDRKIDALQRQNDDQSAQIRKLTSKLRDGEHREELLLADIERLKNQVAELQREMGK